MINGFSFPGEIYEWPTGNTRVFFCSCLKVNAKTKVKWCGDRVNKSLCMVNDFHYFLKNIIMINIKIIEACCSWTVDSRYFCSNKNNVLFLHSLNSLIFVIDNRSYLILSIIGIEVTSRGYPWEPQWTCIALSSWSSKSEKILVNGKGKQFIL